MDSFYDAPRKAPVPTPAGRLELVSVVPEVSILCNNRPQLNNYTPYNVWKAQNTTQQPVFSSSNKENFSSTSSMFKKQVRFESPTFQQRPSLSYEPIIKKPIISEPQPFNGKTFDQIYLANVPNRNLDLSVIEAPKLKTPPRVSSPRPPLQFVSNEIVPEIPKTPKTYQEYRKQIKNDSVTDVFNYRRTPSPSCLNGVRKKTSRTDVPNIKCDGGTQTSAVVEQTSKEGEPSVKDLLKIISQQNEQLLLLQQQVATLINRDQNQQKQITNCVTSTQHEDLTNTPRKRGMSKFSIDLMTSFEVSFRRQAHKHREFMNYEPKIQEITENTNEGSSSGQEQNDGKDNSMQFQEPLQVVESCPSPEPSIKISMNEFESSDDGSDDELTTSEIGESFYRNLMGQVNNILKKAQVQTSDDMQRVAENNGRVPKDKTMRRVKEATLKHLKAVGVALPPENDETTDSDLIGLNPENNKKDYNSNEISFAVKQLLMKYLPAEYLSKVSPQQNDLVLNQEIKSHKGGLIPPRPEFSFASVQYMKKYNLIANNDAVPDAVRPPQQRLLNEEKNRRVLNLSKLKNQPKLL